MGYNEKEHALQPTDALSSDAEQNLKGDADRKTSVISREGDIVNASGHRDQLRRQYGLLSICGLALTIDNAWVALGGSIVVSIANGGPAGILFEFLVACFYYSFIAASIAELTSSIPSAGGVYHWASITPGPKYGRAIGFFTGSLNYFGWIFDLASIVSIPSNVVVQMYALYHPELVIEPWHVYVAFVLITWLCCAFVIFGNRFLPFLNNIGLFLIIVGGLVTIIVVAAMPKVHAPNDFVWGSFDENNVTGWSGGVAFLAGVLNGAFTIGTPDAVTHMAEELPDPKRDMPKAVFAQVGLGTITAFLFAISILYGINDLDAVVTSSGSFPLAEVYSQATGSPGATFGLLFIILLSILICVLGTFLTVGRIWWALARDNAVPFSRFFSHVDERLSCPVPSTIFAAFGAIQLGSKTAFTDLVGSFIILTTTSYALAIGPHLLTGRKNIPRGPFWLGKFGFAINGIAVTLIIFFNIFFCFPYAYPTTVSTMNYNSVILVGVVFLTAFWWVVHGRRKYPGPKLAGLYLEEVIGYSGGIGEDRVDEGKEKEKT
ncbi:hypothetical protein MMC10_005564 [Thelotrema lepadinum]|nr:hypothetical protein [Thelotrema lepadinum]